ncbi:MAG TPA: methyltransferase [Clostridia bacterium]|nr:methyltransferase [Clostridia bacterium]
MTETTPHEQILALGTAFWISRSLQVVAEMGVADALDDAPRTTEQLATSTGAHPVALGRVLRLLASHGIFEAHDGAWAHTPASRLLRDDHPQSVRHFLRLMGLPFVWRSWGELEHSLRTTEPAVLKLDPNGGFAYLAKHPEESRVFNAGMAGKAQREIPAVLSSYDFSRFNRIADIGGGKGHLLLAILQTAPSATGVLFDQPHVIAEAPKDTACIERHGGNFFRDPIPAADAYLLMDVLHDWNEADAKQILAGIRRAAQPGATVLIIETVIPETPGPHLAKALDVNMLVMTGGRERRIAEHKTLLASAGFRLKQVIPTSSPYSIVEAVAVA